MFPRNITLKNGASAVLRTAVPEDAPRMLAYLRAVSYTHLLRLFCVHEP